MGNPKQPQPGDLVIDASALASNIVDNPKDTARTLRKLRTGYKLALTCLLNLDPKILSRAGIDPAQVQAGATASGVIDNVSTFVPAVRKLLEVLLETSQENADILAGVIEEAAAQTKRRAKKDKDPQELLGALEAVLVYQNEPAAKAVKTKIKTGQLKPKAPKHPKRKKAVAAAPAPAAAPATSTAATPAKA